MRILEIVTFICFVVCASASGQAPPNNECAGAIVLAAPGTFAFNTTNATNTSGITSGICPARQRDLWYTWTPTQVGTASFETCGLTALDTNIAVFNTAGVCPTGAPLVCDDDSCGAFESFVSWTTVPGTTYRLQLGRNGGGAGGTGSFTLSFVGPPANDNCATPDVLASGSISQFYDNSIATTGTQGQSNPGCVPKKDLWYRWTARQNGTATLDTCFATSQDTIIAVYLGAACPAAVALACNNNDAACSPQSSVTWSITAGTVYALQIGGIASDPGGTGTFTIVETGTSTGTVFCQGDGAHTACPCANNSAAAANVGCLNSMAVGGRLRGSGSASIANDTFLLTSTQVPNGPGMYFQGTAQAAAGGNGIQLGDGLLCVGGTLVRMGVVFASGNTSMFPSGAFPPISMVGGATAGSVRYYQLWYRDSVAAFCPSATFNLTNGLSLTWAP